MWSLLQHGRHGWGAVRTSARGCCDAIPVDRLRGCGQRRPCRGAADRNARRGFGAIGPSAVTSTGDSPSAGSAWDRRRGGGERARSRFHTLAGPRSRAVDCGGSRPHGPAGDADTHRREPSGSAWKPFSEQWGIVGRFAGWRAGVVGAADSSRRTRGKGPLLGV